MDDTQTLAKRGVAAVAGIAGGAVLLALGALPSVFGIAAGGVAAVVGLACLASRDPDDKKGGAVVTAAGAAALLSRAAPLAPVRAIAGTALSIGAFALLGLGIYNGLKFLRGLRDRAA